MEEMTKVESALDIRRLSVKLKNSTGQKVYISIQNPRCKTMQNMDRIFAILQANKASVSEVRIDVTGQLSKIRPIQKIRKTSGYRGSVSYEGGLYY